MKKNILVFPCGSEIGLEIHKSLAYSTHFNLIGASSVDDHGKYVYRQYIGGFPSVDASNFTAKLNEAVKKYEIDFLFPAHDSVLLKLAQDKAAGQLACEVVTSPVATCEVARMKSKTYEALGKEVPVPRSYSPKELTKNDFPVFLKPDVGQGSKGTQLAKDFAEVEFYLKKDPTLIILEYLPGKEYTVDCFTDKHGKLVFCAGRERIRISNGISVHAVNVKNDQFRSFADKINKKLKFKGVWFFQVKERESGELVLMEIAPRVAGTMGLVRCKGVNLVLLSLFDALGYDIEIFENDYGIVIDRALQNRYKIDIKYSHVYLDFDDLVVIENNINPAVMAFVFQCLNKGTKVHLLTRHKSDIDASLKKYRLSGIFDKQILVKQGEEKCDFIKEERAIFIDDSFAERQKVHKSCQIPTFDSHMLEALMEEL
jgi:predicted ATP-grasp superfamily ATP-dependent carboligase